MCKTHDRASTWWGGQGLQIRIYLGVNLHFILIFGLCTCINFIAGVNALSLLDFFTCTCLMCNVLCPILMDLVDLADFVDLASFADLANSRRIGLNNKI